MENAIHTINIHQAKTHLSSIVEQVSLNKQPVIIAKAGTPKVQIVPLDEPISLRQMGTLKGKFSVPDNFDTFLQEKNSALFTRYSRSPMVFAGRRKTLLTTKPTTAA